MMMEPLFRAIAYISLGVTFEVLFTGVRGLIEEKDRRLQGHTQLWVMPLYGLGGLFVFEPLFNEIQDFNIIFRFAIYGVLILLIEFMSGALYKFILGKCPWEYKNKGNVMGLISLPHFPFWGALGLLFEVVYQYLMAL